MTCAACAALSPDTAAFCPACGAALKDAEEATTVYTPRPPSARPTSAPTQASTPAHRPGTPRSGAGRFGPGQVLAGRYQILGLLGWGGMGEVYRAEVSVARQVSHPNVCRVYDIGEADGHVFGLAAAHDKGVLHRDLKPANVMIDGRGRVRLADFGLAGVAGIEAPGLAGTPAYMAPEQFAGTPASIQSDIYALGLILYEMFTGRAAFTGSTVHELARLHREATPASLTLVVAEIDPAVDRVIQRCLAKDPADRPASALAVSAALPGGDPLAAALAAGETPSPALVAASGGVGALEPVPALLLFLSVILALVPVMLLSQKTQAVQRERLGRAPAVSVPFQGFDGSLLVMAAVSAAGWSASLVFLLAGHVVLMLAVVGLGLLTLIVSLATSPLLDATPLSMDPGSWAFAATATLVGLLLAWAAFGFRTALAGRPLVDGRLLD